jgi:hypothetical protein
MTIFHTISCNAYNQIVNEPVDDEKVLLIRNNECYMVTLTYGELGDTCEWQFLDGLSEFPTMDGDIWAYMDEIMEDVNK